MLLSASSRWNLPLGSFSAQLDRDELILTAPVPMGRSFPKVHHGQDTNHVIANDAIDHGIRKALGQDASPRFPNYWPDFWKLTDQSNDALNFIQEIGPQTGDT